MEISRKQIEIWEYGLTIAIRKIREKEIKKESIKAIPKKIRNDMMELLRGD